MEHKKVSKKARTSSASALKFSLSPQMLPHDQAVVLAEQNPNLSVRIASEKDLTPKSARRSVESWPGFNLAVWPRSSGQTNEAYEALQAFRDECILYDSLLNTTATVSRMDIVSFVMKVLDHNLKRLAKSSSNFCEQFVGTYAEKPFQATSGENINYLRLLKFVGYLQSDSEQLVDCNNLLDLAEQELVDLVSTCGVLITDASEFKSRLRAEVKEYHGLLKDFGLSKGSEKEVSKDVRNIAAHPFSILIFTGYNQPLEFQELESFFPKPSRIFHEKLLGKLAILMADLEKKVTRGDYGGELQLSLSVGFLLVKQFIKFQRKHEREVVWRSLRATIPGQEPSNGAILHLEGIPDSKPLILQQ